MSFKKELVWLWYTILSRIKLLANGRTDQLWYGLQTRMRGLDFGAVPLEKLGLSPERSIHHANSGGPDLRRVLTDIQIPVGSRVLDFGCGKGGAVLTFSEFPFREIAGVELSEGLIRIAEANVSRAGVRHVRLIHCDAASFTDLDRFTHIYMYHPFPCAVVKAVMKNLATSLYRIERRVVLIYKNPECHDTVAESGLFRRDKDFKFEKASHDCNLFRVYIHDA